MAVSKAEEHGGDGERGEPSSASAPSTGLLRRFLPFVIAAALIAFVVSRLDFDTFLKKLAGMNVPGFLGLGFAFVALLLSADAFATVLVYRRSFAGVRYGEFWVLRGASYVPSLLNHHVGQAFLAVALSRQHRVPLARVAGATLVVYASWMGSVLGLLSLAVILTGRSLAWLGLSLGAGIVYLAIIAARPSVLAKRAVLAPLFEAGVGGHLIALVARLPHLVVLFLGTWLPFSFFGVDIPLRDALATIPVLMVAVTLPITPQGWGTRDYLAALFFERFVDAATHQERLAALAAATTSWVVAITLWEALLGLLLLKWALPKVLDSRQRAEADDQSKG